MKKPGDKEEQFTRFLEAAKKAQVDASGRKFGRAMAKIVKAKAAPKRSV